MSERRPKKRPNVFAQVVANADEVVQASFIAAAPGPKQTEAPATEIALSTPPVVDAFMPPPHRSQDTAPTAVDPARLGPELPRPVDTPPAVPAPDSVDRGSTQQPLATQPPVTELALTGDGPAATALPSPEPAQAGESAPSPASQEPGNLRPPAERPGVRMVEPDAAPKVQPRRRAVTAVRRGGQQHWSHQAVFDSFASATIESKNWRLHGFRIVPDVLAQLKTRINADRRSTGNAKLAISHYLDAALRHASTDVDEQVAMAQEFLTVRMGMVEAGKQSTYRVGPQASAWMSDLNVGLQEADYGRKGIYVVSASLESFLSALDDAGSLQLPDRPGAR